MSQSVTFLDYDLNKVINYKINKLVDQARNKKYKIVLFGASIHAQFAVAMLNKLDIKVDIICDSNVNKEGRLFCGYKIQHVSRLQDNGYYIVFLCTIFIILLNRRYL